MEPPPTTCEMNRALILFVALASALSASAGAGYLALVGPVPVRFESRVKPIAAARALLPPLLMQDPLPPTPATNTVAAPTENPPPPAPPTPPVVPVVPPPVAPTITVTNAPAPLPPAPIPPATGPLLSPLGGNYDPTSLLTPQMLIHYFRPQGTNAAGVNVLAPIFLPPPPPTPPGSTVRYTTP